MREQTTTMYDARNLSINFLGILDSRKTVLAINKRRATLSIRPTEIAQPKEPDLKSANADTQFTNDLEVRDASQVTTALIHSGYDSHKSINDKSN